MPVDMRTALANARRNPHAAWHFKAASGDRSADANSASNRVYDGFAAIRVDYDGPALVASSPVFAMGSCFAREIEFHLRKFGGKVVSVDPDLINHPSFADEEGTHRTGFFHRYTPRSMLQEFKAAFGEIPEWDQENSLLVKAPNGFDDTNYMTVWPAGSPLQAILHRRRVAHELVRRAASADVIVLTLGFIECWRQSSTGLDLNRFSPHLAREKSDDFAFDVMTVEEVEACLEHIRDLLFRHHVTGQFQMVITVSPVPLGKTFTGDDIVVANCNSKSTLRTAAGRFCGRHGNVHYFPSYEMVLHSGQGAAWRPDKLHVNPHMVQHVVKSFLSAYYEAGSLSRLDEAKMPDSAETEPS